MNYNFSNALFIYNFTATLVDTSVNCGRGSLATSDKII